VPSPAKPTGKKDPSEHRTKARALMEPEDQFNASAGRALHQRESRPTLKTEVPRFKIPHVANGGDSRETRSSRRLPSLPSGGHDGRRSVVPPPAIDNIETEDPPTTSKQAERAAKRLKVERQEKPSLEMVDAPPLQVPVAPIIAAIPLPFSEDDLARKESPLRPPPVHVPALSQGTPLKPPFSSYDDMRASQFGLSPELLNEGFTTQTPDTQDVAKVERALSQVNRKISELESESDPHGFDVLISQRDMFAETLTLDLGGERGGAVSQPQHGVSLTPPPPPRPPPRPAKEETLVKPHNPAPSREKPSPLIIATGLKPQDMVSPPLSSLPPSDVVLNLSSTWCPARH